MVSDEMKKAVNGVRITGEVVCNGNTLIRELRESTSDGVVKMALNFIHLMNRSIFDQHKEAIDKLVELVKS